MADTLRLDIDPPVHGWATVRLSAPGVALTLGASYTPRDSIADLARAAALSLAGVPDQIVVWNTEPVEYEFRFVATAGRTRLEVHEFADGRRIQRGDEAPIAVIEGDTSAISCAIWRGLRRLQGAVLADEYATTWRHPFPAAAVERLGIDLRARMAQGRRNRANRSLRPAPLRSALAFVGRMYQIAESTGQRQRCHPQPYVVDEH